MANTSSRTLRLLTLLQTHRFWPGAELAERLGVTDRTLRRDIERLRELGYPVRSNRGTDGGYQLAPGATMPPLVVDAEEAVAIVVALRAAAQGAAAALNDAPVRALAKVMQVLPKPLRKRADAVRHATTAPTWGEAPALDTDLLTTIAQACRDSVRLHFGYTAREGAVTSRRVEPHHLVPIGRRWYLVAWDLERHDWRSFRLDRITDPETTLINFRPKEVPGGPVEYVRQGLRGRDVHQVTAIVHLDGPADAVRQQLGRYGEVTELTATSCEFRAETDEVKWVLFGIAGTGYGFTVHAPPELTELLGEWSDRFSDAVRRGSTTQSAD
ncbi:helix-turn-helix transcriptional regulator [Propionibacteriaceae bacterium Y2011]